MYLIDYHLHTKFSVDGREEPMDIFQRAWEQGLQEIAVTDHVDFSSQTCCSDEMDYDSVLKAVQQGREKYQGKLKIKMGVELGQPQHNPAEAVWFQDNRSPDFIIGSIHNIRDSEDLGLYDLSQIDEEALYQDYLQQLIILAKEYDYDVLGHLTYPLRYLYAQCRKTVRLEDYWPQFEQLFLTVIQRGKGIELNTSGFRQAIGEPLPPEKVLRFYRECGGEIITLGSDAHTVKDVGAGIQEGYALLEALGFRWIAAYENRKPQFHAV